MSTETNITRRRSQGRTPKIGGQSVSVRLNHTIVWCRDKKASAQFLSDVLGLAPPYAFGPFLIVEVANDVSLDYHETAEEITSQHYAFLVSENEFDSAFEKICEMGLDYWADPALAGKGRINRNDGGRGCYFKDPDGHLLEIITRPYGSGG